MVMIVCKGHSVCPLHTYKETYSCRYKTKPHNSIWSIAEYPTIERYVPNSELEHMKDKVFALVDWES